jgi:hypothetical protein
MKTEKGKKENGKKENGKKENGKKENGKKENGKKENGKPCAAVRGLAGLSARAPDEEGALPASFDLPASDAARSDTSGRGMRPLGTCAQGALLPETPARNGGAAPFPPYPRMRRRVTP